MVIQSVGVLGLSVKIKSPRGVNNCNNSLYEHSVRPITRWFEVTFCDLIEKKTHPPTCGFSSCLITDIFNHLLNLNLIKRAKKIISFFLGSICFKIQKQRACSMINFHIIWFIISSIDSTIYRRIFPSSYLVNLYF